MIFSLTKLGVITLGCPKNTADTESLLAELEAQTEIVALEKAEIVLLNTCAFLQSARAEVYQTLDALKNRKVILTGCLSGLLDETIFKEYPQVSAVVSGANYPYIREILQSVFQGDKIFAVSAEPKKFTSMSGKTLITAPYAYIKIAEGCNNGCAFCLIPKLKGFYRSRPLTTILAEAKALIQAGVKEIILVAQDCGFYGVDLYGKKCLAELLQKLAKIKGDFWIRVLYVYPERIDTELLSVMKQEPKICRYLDIPLQHGDPEILKQMRRPSNVEKTLQTIQKIRETIPDITLRTSLITGFPGEKEKHFQNLLKFIREIQFDHLGVFEYSREEDTPAYTLKNQVNAKTKQKRREEAMLLQQQISLQKNQTWIGQTVRALIENYDPQNKVYLARSMRFAPEIDGLIFIQTEKKLKSNAFYNVQITKATEYDLYAKIILN